MIDFGEEEDDVIEESQINEALSNLKIGNSFFNTKSGAPVLYNLKGDIDVKSVKMYAIQQTNNSEREEPIRTTNISINYRINISEEIGIIKKINNTATQLHDQYENFIVLINMDKGIDDADIKKWTIELFQKMRTRRDRYDETWQAIYYNLFHVLKQTVGYNANVQIITNLNLKDLKQFQIDLKLTRKNQEYYEVYGQWESTDIERVQYNTAKNIFKKYTNLDDLRVDLIQKPRFKVYDFTLDITNPLSFIKPPPTYDNGIMTVYDKMYAIFPSS